MVRSKRLLTPVLALALAGCVFNADQTLPKRVTDATDLVPANAQVVAFADMSSALGTFQELVAMDNSGDFPEAWAKMQEAFAQVNMDPERDIDFVVMYGSEGSQPVATAVGRFDVDAIADFIEAEMPELQRVEGDGLTAWTHDFTAIALSNDGTRALAGRDVAALEAALQVRGGANLASVGGPAMQKDSWMIMRDLPSMQGDGEFPIQEFELLARAVSDAALGGSLTTDEAAGTMVLHPREGVSADDLAALVRGVIGAMRMQEIPDEVRERLEAVDVEASAGTVVVTGSVTRTFLEQIARS
ncbi:MAG: hypothetical protein JJ896_14180 [Rhodothermales bacterium]|nr:hypothetical protein [Rhodothermales bacterium]MBO6780797.1 hypothetical protein [Rhodothermales bacterium]